MIRTDLTYYVSGPMTGLPNYNYPAFQKTTERLRGMGLQVVSPHEIASPTEALEGDALWQYYMDACLACMEGCKALVLLRGWTHSSGARIELQKALDEKWEAFYFYKDNPGTLIPMHM